jgi:hypothetical protein
MKLKTAQFLSILLFSLVMGVFWGTWFSLSRTIDSISAPTFLETGKQFIGNLAWPMRILMPLSLGSTLPVLLFLPRRSTPFYLTLVGLLLMILATVITVTIEVPIDNMIKVWTIESLPSNWQALREKWEWYHVIRTFISIGAFCSLLIASLMTPRHRN